MKPITAEWVAKAEGDFAIMEREGRVRKNPGYDGICFHAQQCAEKCLKARLSEGDIEFGKTHDLVTLLHAVTPMEPSWDAHRRDLACLSVFAVTHRCPGDSAAPAQAKDAIRRCRLFRKAVRQAMGLDAVNCLTPVESANQHYCPRCGSVTGEFTRHIPFVNIRFKYPIWGTLWHRVWAKETPLAGRVTAVILIIALLACGAGILSGALIPG